MKFILPMMMLAAMPLAADAQNKSGLVMSNLDKTAKPADDFYQFATGGWQKSHPLPAAYSRYGSFDQLAENSNKRINSILDELKKKTYKKEPSSRSFPTSISWRSISIAAIRRALLL